MHWICSLALMFAMVAGAVAVQRYRGMLANVCLSCGLTLALFAGLGEMPASFIVGADDGVFTSPWEVIAVIVAVTFGLWLFAPIVAVYLLLTGNPFALLFGLPMHLKAISDDAVASASATEFVVATLGCFAFANLCVAIVSMLPCYPLAAGRILDSRLRPGRFRTVWRLGGTAVCIFLISVAVIALFADYPEVVLPVFRHLID